MSKKRTIYSALPIVAAAYGEKLGVKVAIGNDDAYTDGKTIVVPNIPDDYPNMDAVWGYLAMKPPTSVLRILVSNAEEAFMLSCPTFWRTAVLNAP
ncbi:hypothetical protein ACOP3E_25135 (plasmid) [Escherichia coli]